MGLILIVTMDKISKTLLAEDLRRTQIFGINLGSRLKGGEIIVLTSDLGGGKTTLVKSIAKGAGSKDLVSSPSFTICNQYLASVFTIYHFDFYRLNDPGIISFELNELIEDKKAVIIIEWPQIVDNILPESRLININIQIKSENSRIFNIELNNNLNYLF